MARTVKEWVGKTDDHMPGKIVRLRILARQGGACPSCTKQIVSGSNPACDHITPLADGGENVEGNLQILCGPCHGLKTSAENRQRARERTRKAKTLGLTKPKSRSTFRKPAPGIRYEPGPFGLRPVRGDVR